MAWIRIRGGVPSTWPDQGQRVLATWVDEEDDPSKARVWITRLLPHNQGDIPRWWADTDDAQRPYGEIPIEDRPTHWMPLPVPPSSSAFEMDKEGALWLDDSDVDQGAQKMDQPWRRREFSAASALLNGQYVRLVGRIGDVAACHQEDERAIGWAMADAEAGQSVLVYLLERKPRKR